MSTCMRPPCGAPQDRAGDPPRAPRARRHAGRGGGGGFRASAHLRACGITTAACKGGAPPGGATVDALKQSMSCPCQFVLCCIHKNPQTDLREPRRRVVLDTANFGAN